MGKKVGLIHSSGDSLPTLGDVLRAGRVISRYLPRTPLYYYPSLSQLLGAEVHIKHENHLPTGAFKVRGGINLISRLTREEKERGVISASTGNHGQSIAYASRLFSVRATIVVPQRANPEKVESIRNLGAETIFSGRDFDEAREYTERLVAERGYRYIHSANEPLLIAGVGTHTLEVLEELPEVDAILVPVGGGSGACGTCIVAKAVNPGIQVIGVQAEKAPAAFLSWKQGRIVTAGMETSAEGLATRMGFELTQRILRRYLDDFILVTEEEMHRAVLLLLEKTHNLAEEAGAAPLAAALKIADCLQGKQIALILSGGNLSLSHLREILAEQGRGNGDVPNFTPELPPPLPA